MSSRPTYPISEALRAALAKKEKLQIPSNVEDHFILQFKKNTKNESKSDNLNIIDSPPGPNSKLLPDKKAESEAVALASGELEKEAKTKEHERSERFKDHVSNAVIALFWIAFTFVVFAGTFWIYHMISPVSWHFLSEPQVEKIGNLIFGGFLSTFINEYAKKRLN